MDLKANLYTRLTKKIDGYQISLLEIISLIVTGLLLAFLSISNLEMANDRSVDSEALKTYDKLKQAIYHDMSSPNPTKRYLMRNISGPGSLPPPFEDFFLKDGVVVNYLIRVYESARNGRPKDQLRFEVSHKNSQKLYRYSEVNGVVLEQVVSKE